MKQQHACIINDGETLRIGSDLVDAYMGKRASHGTLQLANGRRMGWVSTKPISATEALIRKAAKQDGVRIVLFTSQAIGE